MKDRLKQIGLARKPRYSPQSESRRSTGLAVALIPHKAAAAFRLTPPDFVINNQTVSASPGAFVIAKYGQNQRTVMHPN